MSKYARLFVASVLVVTAITLIIGFPSFTGIASADVPVTGLSPQLVSAAEKEGTLTWYTAENTDIAEAAVAEFNKSFPGIKVKVNRSGAEALANQVLMQSQAGVHDDDVLTVYDFSTLHDFAATGMLEKFSPPNAKQIDAKFSSLTDPSYVVTTGDAYVIAYNTHAVTGAAIPRDWNDLLASRWKDQIVLNSPSFSGDALLGATGLSTSLGWNFYQSLQRQGPLVVQSIPQTMDPVISGERQISMTSVQLVQQLMEKGQPVAFTLPRTGSVFLPGGTAVLSSAPHPNAAKLFEDFYLSVQMQRKFAELGFFPVRKGVEVPSGKLGLSALKLIIVDPVKLKSDKPVVKAKFKEMFGS